MLSLSTMLSSFNSLYILLSNRTFWKATWHNTLWWLFIFLPWNTELDNLFLPSSPALSVASLLELVLLPTKKPQMWYLSSFSTFVHIFLLPYIAPSPVLWTPIFKVCLKSLLEASDTSISLSVSYSLLSAIFFFICINV